MCRLKTGTIFSIVPYRLNNYASFMSQSKMTNTVRKLLIVGPPQSEVPPGGLFIDIAQCLSIVNRKSYRQGMNYAIANMKIYAIDSGSVMVNTLPNNWCMDNATTKIFETWKDQRAAVLKENPTLKAKWSDFKVFMNSHHAQLDVFANLIPSSPDGTPYLPGEWNPSKVVAPIDGGAAGTSNEVTVHVVGDHQPAGIFDATTTSLGAIASYQRGRALIQSPDPVHSGFIQDFYAQISSHDEMGENILDNITNHNDNPPYNRDNMPGGPGQLYLEIVDLATLNNYGDATSFSTYSVGPFVPALGLINVIPNMNNNANVTFEIDLVPGKYKGVLAERGL